MPNRLLSPRTARNEFRSPTRTRTDHSNDQRSTPKSSKTVSLCPTAGKGEAVTHHVRRYAGIPKGLQAPASASIQEESANDTEIEFGLAAAVSDAEGMDPLTLEECRSRSDWPKWDEAIKVELGALKKARTWRVVERPKDRNVVDSKWVFQIKKNAAGQIEKFKARLVTKGFTQVKGVDYFDDVRPRCQTCVYSKHSRDRREEQLANRHVRFSQRFPKWGTWRRLRKDTGTGKPVVLPKRVMPVRVRCRESYTALNRDPYRAHRGYARVGETGECSCGWGTRTDCFGVGPVSQRPRPFDINDDHDDHDDDHDHDHQASTTTPSSPAAANGPRRFDDGGNEAGKPVRVRTMSPQHSSNRDSTRRRTTTTTMKHGRSGEGPVFGGPAGGPTGTRDPDRFCAGLRSVGTGPAFETRG